MGIKVMLVPFTTTITQKASFACPLGNDASEFEVRYVVRCSRARADRSTVQGLLKSLGINIDDLGALAVLLR